MERHVDYVGGIVDWELRISHFILRSKREKSPCRPSITSPYQNATHPRNIFILHS